MCPRHEFSRGLSWRADLPRSQSTMTTVTPAIKFSAGINSINISPLKAAISTCGNLVLPRALQYYFNPSFAMRAEAERYRINDAVGNHGDIDLFSLGVVFGFGGPAPQERPWRLPPPTAMPEPMPAPGVSDHDGVSNDIDKCPGTPRGVAVDGTGCPLIACGDFKEIPEVTFCRRPAIDSSVGIQVEGSSTRAEAWSFPSLARCCVS